MKSFESWLYDEVELMFDLVKVKNYKPLQEWLAAKVEIDDIDKILIDRLKDKLADNVIGWNEDELKMQFIYPFLSIINFVTDKYKPFSQRELSLKTDKVETSGLLDFVIATGKSKPREPFIFLHKYKQLRPSKKRDLIGQLLIEMVAAQFKNANNHPVYGILVEGRFWYFIVLHNKEYSVSNPFDACDIGIYQIFAIVCKTKNYIEEIIKIKK